MVFNIFTNICNHSHSEFWTILITPKEKLYPKALASIPLSPNPKWTVTHVLCLDFPITWILKKNVSVDLLCPYPCQVSLICLLSFFCLTEPDISKSLTSTGHLILPWSPWVIRKQSLAMVGKTLGHVGMAVYMTCLELLTLLPDWSWQWVWLRNGLWCHC